MSEEASNGYKWDMRILLTRAVTGEQPIRFYGYEHPESGEIIFDNFMYGQVDVWELANEGIVDLHIHPDPLSFNREWVATVKYTDKTLEAYRMMEVMEDL